MSASAALEARSASAAFSSSVSSALANAVELWTRGRGEGEWEDVAI